MGGRRGVCRDICAVCAMMYRVYVRCWVWDRTCGMGAVVYAVCAMMCVVYALPVLCFICGLYGLCWVCDAVRCCVCGMRVVFYKNDNTLQL